MQIRFDCRHFKGDRPCEPHKREGVHCEGCPHYDQALERILIVKLDAVGDVLRTTCILPGLRTTHPAAWIDWLTREEATPIFFGNPMVDRVIPFPGEAIPFLLANAYEAIINLDSSPTSAMLASIAKGFRKIGYGYDARGYVYPWNEEAKEWFEMGLFDDVKMKNRKTYQKIVMEICRLPDHDSSIRLYLSREERDWARSMALDLGIDPFRTVIGLNTGAGSRWEHKKWTENGFVELIRLLKTSNEPGRVPPQILLLGGPAEKKRNEEIFRRSEGMAIDAGTAYSLRNFFAVVDLCDLVVTGDTMALHVAVALGKKVVALFGPTSPAEIELYDCGIKIVPDAECVGCYLSRCDITPSCMERISAGEVFRAVRNLL